MPLHQRRSSAAKNRASCRTLKSYVVASLIVSKAASPTSLLACEVSPNVSSKAGSLIALLAHKLSPLPYTPTSPTISSPTLTVKAIPSILGRKRPTFKAISVTVTLVWWGSVVPYKIT